MPVYVCVDTQTPSSAGAAMAAAAIRPLSLLRRLQVRIYSGRYQTNTASVMWNPVTPASSTLSPAAS
jgi:hypothetical protein